MHRSLFALCAAFTIGGSLLGAQSRPAKTPPAPAPAPTSKPSPASAPAPIAKPDPFFIYDDDVRWDLERIKAEALANLPMQRAELDRIKAEALAAIPTQQMELARLKAMDVAANAKAVADLQVAMNLDQIKEQAYASVAEAGFAMNKAFGGGWSTGYRTQVPEPWVPQDVADSLYREGRKALSADQYEKAASLFQSIWRRYPSSAYTADAYYWQAFSLQRQGGDKNLGEALASLETQAQKFPKAATAGDAKALRARIEGQLGRRGDQAMATTMRNRAERASDGCPRTDEDERIEALNAIVQIDRDQALPILKKMLARREPCTQQLRRTAVMLIARNKQPEVAQTLMGVAKNDPDREVREQAVFWLANVQGDEATDMLIDLARTGDDLELRKRAVYSLSRSKSTKAQQTLRSLVLDENQPEEVRGDALNWVTSRGNGMEPAQSVSYLKDVYNKGGTINFRNRVLSLLGSTRSDEARSFFTSVALNEREPMDLRRNAVSMLGSSGRWNVRGQVYSMSYSVPVAVATTVNGVVSTNVSTNVSGQQQNVRPAPTDSEKTTMSAAAQALMNVYDKVGDMDLKRQALSSLANVGDAGVDRLLDIAKNEKNSELRRSAVSYLTRVKDPRALQLLQDIVNK